jgi:hypothetical protein
MVINEIDSGTQEQTLTNRHSGTEDESRVCKGNYVGIVRPSENQYDFLVRDLRRESPTIFGSRVDFIHASAAVSELMDALTHEP